MRLTIKWQCENYRSRQLLTEGDKALPGFMSSAVEAVRSVQKMRVLANKTGAQVVTGHDPDAWPTFRHAPEYYD